MKTILYGSEARKAIMRGIDLVVACVSTTLGPAGRNALIIRPMRDPISSRDGFTVLRNIELEDELDAVGCRLIQGVSMQQALEAGDSTTSVAILTRAIAQRALDAVDAGANPVVLKREIEEAVAAIRDNLASAAVPLDGDSALKVALLASNDVELGTLIAEAFDKAGERGLVGAEESQNVASSIRVSEGMEIPSGYISHLFVNDAERQRVVLERPYILLLDRKLSILNNLLVNIFKPVFEKEQRSLLIIADDCDGEALRNLVAQRAKFPVCVVKPSLIGEYKKDLLTDIAVATGGEAILQETGRTEMLDKLTLHDLGQAERVIVTRHATTIIGGMGDPDAIRTRADIMVAQMGALIANQDRKKDVHRIEERLARFGGKIVLLSLGAPTRIELEDLKLRAEDAIYAVRGARDKGVVPGGGASLLRESHKVYKQLSTQAAALLSDACSTLFGTLCRNAGETEAAMCIIASKLMNSPGSVYDIRAGRIRDPWKSGVLDPSSVVSSCLVNAASVACQILLTESLVINTPTDPMKAFEMGARAGQR
jgi:chaperonin GroEL